MEVTTSLGGSARHPPRLPKPRPETAQLQPNRTAPPLKANVLLNDVTRERALGALDRIRPEIVVFTSPNNPTGNTIDDAVILAAAERHPETLVLVDEAYSDFAGTSLVSRMDEFPNLIVSKTFSKVLAAAGLRVGSLIVHPELMGYFTAAALPYNVSTLTLAVAARVAKDDAAIAHRLELAAKERARVLAALRRVQDIEVFPSVTNFILFRLRDGKPADIHAKLLEQGVLIRDIPVWPGCEGCLRASLGIPEENDRFIAALDTLFAAAAGRP